MQIYALDKKGNLLQAKEGSRRQDYLCPECKIALRIRGGQWRRLHFYHLHPSPNCRSNGKSLTHLQIQYAIQKLLIPEDVILECRFPEINRIADVAWPSKKIIFEIQCSAISREEVEARCRDYRSMGYCLVWILHDKLFNRFHLSDAETYLQSAPHYFTNINAFGKGMFYDQFAWIKAGRRIKRYPRQPIHIQRVTFFPNGQVKDKQTAGQIPKERKKWPLAFAGDLFHRGMPYSFLKREKRSWKRRLSKLAIPYRAVFHLLLEKTTD